MSRTGAALLAVWLLAACTNAAEDRPAATSVIVMPRLDAQAPLPDRPAERASGRTALSSGSMPDDVAAAADTATSTPVDEPVAVASDEVLRLIEAEDLFVLDLQTGSTEAADGTSASVQVRVLYGTGRGHPIGAIYRVELDLVGRAWTVTSVKATS